MSQDRYLESPGQVPNMYTLSLVHLSTLLFVSSPCVNQVPGRHPLSFSDCAPAATRLLGQSIPAKSKSCKLLKHDVSDVSPGASVSATACCLKAVRHSNQLKERCCKISLLPLSSPFSSLKAVVCHFALHPTLFLRLPIRWIHHGTCLPSDYCARLTTRSRGKCSSLSAELNCSVQRWKKMKKDERSSFSIATGCHYVLRNFIHALSTELWV